MIDKEQQSADDDVPAILHQMIFAEWQTGKTIREIARKMDLNLATVTRILKRMQKSKLDNAL